MDVEIEFLDDEEVAEQDQNAKTESKAGEQQGEGDSEEEEDGPPFYADEESTFIPLTWSTKLPRSYYRGSDPEWQDFIKIAKDKSRQKKVQDELVAIVHTGSVSHPTIIRQLGKDPKVGKYWLDITFPDGPPQEYERSGIEIGDGFIAWSQQKVSQEKQWRTMRALWPQAAAQGSWATIKVLAGIQWRRVKQGLGLEEADPLSPEERYRSALQLFGGGGSKQQSEGRGPSKPVGSKTQTEPDAASAPGAIMSRASSTPASPTPPPPDGTKPRAPSSDPPTKLPWPIATVPLPSSTTSAVGSTDVPIAIHVFSAALSKTWNPKKMEPPRGTFVVAGMVEVRGQRGRMLFDVQSSYDPKAGKYVQVNAAVRGYKRWSQAPRGGA